MDHALLSHPELVTVNETPSSDGLSVAATTALDRLRKRWSNIVEASRDLYRWSPITCEECLRNRRVTDGRFAGRGMYSASGREPCPHTTVGSQALRSLCEAHGELVFELVQWLVPSTVVQSFGEVILPPRRFVLHHELMTALVAQWLLGRSRDAWRQEWLRGYRPNPTTARTHYVRRSHRASGTLDSQTHAAVRFAADAWGIENDTEVERLFALRDPDEADHPAPRLRTDPDIAERIESARVLPEEPSRADWHDGAAPGPGAHARAAPQARQARRDRAAGPIRGEPRASPGSGEGRRQGDGEDHGQGRAEERGQRGAEERGQRRTEAVGAARGEAWTTQGRARGRGSAGPSPEGRRARGRSVAGQAPVAVIAACAQGVQATGGEGSEASGQHAAERIDPGFLRGAGLSGPDDPRKTELSEVTYRVCHSRSL